jgi:hypothetical protein
LADRAADASGDDSRLTATALEQFTQPAASGIWAVALAATVPFDRPINLKKA